MKIVFVLDSLNHGGAERVVSELSNYFVLNKNHVSIVLLSNLENPFYELDKRISVLSLGSSKKSRFSRIKSLRRCIVNEKPDVAIAFLPHVCAYTYFAIRNENIPLIVSERNDPSKMSFILRTLSKHIFKKASGNVYQTSDAKEWYANHSASNSIVIPNPIVVPKKGELATYKKKKTILFSGRLQEQKNVGFLIECFSIFVKKYRDYKLLIYGNGYLDEALKSQCKSLSITSSVIFCGPDHDWLVKNLDASLFLMTSLYEGMPNSLLEAASHGLNCLSSNCTIGGPKELSHIYPNIGLFDTFDVQEVTKKIEENIFKEVNIELIMKANKYLSIDNIGRMWLNFIRKIIYNE